ncbi:MAG: hypothetical protein M3259_03255 [Actinomycetota bacterium]|nr:hypothetical protein [Actinomycetota bacterium]
MLRPRGPAFAGGRIPDHEERREGSAAERSGFGTLGAMAGVSVAPLTILIEKLADELRT